MTVPRDDVEGTAGRGKGVTGNAAVTSREQNEELLEVQEDEQQVEAREEEKQQQSEEGKQQGQCSGHTKQANKSTKQAY